MGRSANAISQPKSPEIVGPVSSGLRRSTPLISPHGEFMSSIADVPALTTPSQELVTDSVAPPPDSSPKRPSHLAPRICSPPPFVGPTGILLSHVASAPHYPPRSLLKHLDAGIKKPSGLRHLHFAKEPSPLERPIPDRRIRGESDSNNEHPLRYEDGSSLSHFRLPSQASRFNSRFQRTRIDYLSDFTGPPGPIPSHFDLALSLFTEEHGPESEGSDGFSSDTSRAVCLLGDRDDSGNRPSSRNSHIRFFAPEFWDPIYPALLPGRVVDRSDGNSQFRSFGRTDPLSHFSPVSPNTSSPILTFGFSNRTSSLLSALSYSQGTWHIMQDPSAVSLLAFGVSNTLLPLGLRPRTTMLIPQLRWVTTLEGEVCQLPDGATLDILQGHGYDPRERGSGASLERRPTTHIHIVRCYTFIQSAEVLTHLVDTSHSGLAIVIRRNA